jgi:L-aminopeptidase/D-esterase-like protein
VSTSTSEDGASASGPRPALAGDPAAPGPSGSVNDTLTCIGGLRVGHWQDHAARTGCTVVLLPDEGAVTSGLVLGAAPGSRESALLAPEKTVERAHALVLSGGSAFGLAAAHGVMRWLEARGVGYPTPGGPVPIVPAAVLYDLVTGDGRVRPGEVEGIAAADAASSAPVAQGSVGAGTGAMVGKFAGFDKAQRSGLGSAVLRVRDAVVAAIGVSNAVGDLVDPDSGEVVAGCGLGRDPEAAVALFAPAPGVNTTLVAVATDAPLTKAQAHALSYAAHIGIARVTRPSHTVHDGDTTFVVSTGRGPAVDLGALSVAVQEVVAKTLLRGARAVRERPR